MRNKFILAAIILAVAANSSFAQEVNITGRQPKFQVVYDDSLAGAVTKILLPSSDAHGWFKTEMFQSYSVWVTFDTTGFGAGIGLTSADTVEISCEQFTDDDNDSPVLSSTGFYEFNRLEREVVATYDSTKIIDNLKTFIHFNGTSSDPELAPGGWVRFYSRVVGGFTGGGLGLKIGLQQQP